MVFECGPTPSRVPPDSDAPSSIVLRPDSWKSYTIGDPLAPSKYPWRLDDEQVMYLFYEKAVKAGITTLASTRACCHPITKSRSLASGNTRLPGILGRPPRIGRR